MIPFKTIDKAGDLKGKRVLLRLDLNEPVIGGKIQNDFRLRRSLKTILFLKKKKARVVIISHAEKNRSLKPVVSALNRFVKVDFLPYVCGQNVSKRIGNLSEGDVLVLENLRKDKGEEKNSASFAKKLACLGDFYVNEAFSVSHRPHASIVRLPKLMPSYAGFLFAEEYENLSKFLKPEKPLYVVLGGAKLETKLPLLKKYLPVTEGFFLGGGPANSFLKLRGYEIGQSVFGGLSGLKNIAKSRKIILPEDVLLLSGKTVSVGDISSADKIVDVGPKSLRKMKEEIANARTIIFNGPVGIYDKGFSSGTEGILKILKKSSAKVVVGGGDTVALVSKLKMEKEFYFVSTSGGAALEFLAKGTMPGIKSLK